MGATAVEKGIEDFDEITTGGAAIGACELGRLWMFEMFGRFFCNEEAD